MADINSISPSLRDKLLSKNLIFSNSIPDSYIQQYGHGLGKPVDIGDENASVIQSEDIENIGKIIRKELLSKNKFFPTLDMQERILLIDNKLNIQDSVYGDYYTNGVIKNLQETHLSEGIVNLANGSRYDTLGTSLAYRLATPISSENETPMGIIGKEALVNEMKERVKNNIYSETIGKINLNVISLLSGNEFIKSDYRITRSDSAIGRLGDTALDMLGIQPQTAKMTSDASIFTFDSSITPLGTQFPNTVEQNNAILRNTGRGQQGALYALFQLNNDPRINGGGRRYSPNYEFDRLKASLEDSEYSKMYDDEVYDFEEYPDSLVDGYKRDPSTTFSWVNAKGVNEQYKTPNTDHEDKPYFEHDVKSERVFSDTKTLLGKTQELFNQGKIKTLISNKGMNVSRHELITGVDQHSSGYYMISKGSQVMYSERSTQGSSANPNEVFCRSWVNSHRYEKVNKLQKHRGLDINGGNRSNAIVNSVLDDNGFVKFTPHNKDNGSKKFMFSIENLAWCRDLDSLPEWEIGDGDPLTKTKGRIMWFPPYGLDFSENTGLNLDTHHFIGRGEPIYTYNSTERSGSLNFKIIIDHPEWMNNPELVKDYDLVLDDLMHSIIAGCGELPEYFSGVLSKDELNKLEVEMANNPIIKPIENEIAPPDIEMYFPNDVASLGNFSGFSLDSFDYDLANFSQSDLTGEYAFMTYETLGTSSKPKNTQWGVIKNQGFTAGLHTDNKIPYNDRFDYGLNKSWKNQAFLKELKDKLINECPSCRVIIDGYANFDGKNTSNKKLSNARAESVQNFFEQFILNDDVVDRHIRFGANDSFIKGLGEDGEKNNKAVDDISKKTYRRVIVSFVPDPNVKSSEIEAYKKNLSDETKRLFNTKLKSRFYNEAMHFEKLKLTDSITYNRIKEKIKYFEPSFHSITPEGFNSRLTFLNQCTRQGSTKSSHDRPDNMVFGAPPICILRIGDFYNTKIIIDTLSIDYEGIWDINPEGVGVQPMIANIMMSFKFLGGSSMGGAINRLQNALSFNYYANTEVFDPRAYSISTNGVDGDVRYVQGTTDVSESMYSKLPEQLEDSPQDELPNNNNTDFTFGL